jgi:hypothetical protein
MKMMIMMMMQQLAGRSREIPRASEGRYITERLMEAA